MYGNLPMKWQSTKKPTKNESTISKGVGKRKKKANLEQLSEGIILAELSFQRSKYQNFGL